MFNCGIYHNRRGRHYLDPGSGPIDSRHDRTNRPQDQLTCNAAILAGKHVANNHNIRKSTLVQRGQQRRQNAWDDVVARSANVGILKLWTRGEKNYCIKKPFNFLIIFSRLYLSQEHNFQLITFYCHILNTSPVHIYSLIHSFQIILVSPIIKCAG